MTALRKPGAMITSTTDPHRHRPARTMSALVRSLARPPLDAALKLDAVVTGAVGATYVVAAGPLNDLLGVAPGVWRGVGAFLLVFAVGVWFARRPAAGVIVAANCLWVLGSILVAAAGWGSPTTAGTLWILLQAIVVAGFAELQIAALRRPAR